MMPRFKLLASFSCLCSEGLIFPTSGSQTVTSSFVEAIGDGIKKFAPDSYMPKCYEDWIPWQFNKLVTKTDSTSWTGFCRIIYNY